MWEYLKKITPGLLLILILLSLLLLIRHMDLLLNKVQVIPRAPGQDDRSIEIFRQILTMTSVGLFLILVVIAQIARLSQRKNSTNRITKRLVPWSWIVGAAVGLASVSSLIIYVNPRGLYGTDFYQTRLLLARNEKLNYYSRLQAAPDIVILGSSRAFMLWPKYIKQDLGYSAFNFSAERATYSVVDFVILTRYIIDQSDHVLPKVLLIEIIPPLPTETETIVDHLPLKLLPYMDYRTARSVIQTRFEEVFNLQQLAEAFYVLRYYQQHGNPPQAWTFNPDGSSNHRSGLDLAAALERDTGNLEALTLFKSTQLNEEGIQSLETLVALADEYKMSLVFYESPRHPAYYDALLKHHAIYQQSHAALVSYMHDLTSRYPFVFFLDYSRLENIGGVADETGYYDSQHLTPLNSHYLLIAAADTLRQAYDVAVEQRVRAKR